MKITAGNLLVLAFLLMLMMFLVCALLGYVTG